LITGLPITGSLKAVKDAFIKARVAGELMDMQLKEGDVVRAGQILGRIDPVEYQRRLKQAQETAEAAKSQIDIAQRQYENNKALVDQGFISKTALESSLSNLQTAQATFRAAQAGADIASKALDDSVMRAPFAGQVSARFAQSGERLGVDAKVLEIIDVSHIEVETTISASDSVGLKVGQEALLRVEGSAQTYKAVLTRINPSAQTGSRSVLAYLNLKDIQGLRQGLFAQGTLNLTKRTVLCVTSQDIQHYKPEPFVQIIDAGVVKHQAIKTGISGYLSTTDNENKWTEIIGLPLNTQVLKSHLGVVRENVLVKFTQDVEKH
jgi:RND family efflux transporter MFP subunit